MVFDASAGAAPNHYNYFRDYDPAIGRYVESDPAGLRGGRNTYAYVDGTPLIAIDPMGLWRDPRNIYDDAMRDARLSGLPGGHNGPQDAYRHCLASCEMSRENGKGITECMAWGNEKKGDWFHNQERGERSMDDFNNAMGVALGKGAGSYQACKDLCMAATTRRTLKTYSSGSSPGYWR